MRLSVFSPKSSSQLFIDLQKLYQGYLSEQELTSKALQKLINTPDKLFFVSLFNARHLSAVQVSITKEGAQLSLLCVRDITRRRGVGKNLLLEVEKNLQTKGIHKVQLLLSEITEDEQPGLILFLQACGYQRSENKLIKQI
ncbi:MAG: aspartate 1-decarboxylase autocleavage activator PanM [Psychromonas sp.]